jgi:hypothetical protein
MNRHVRAFVALLTLSIGLYAGTLTSSATGAGQREARIDTARLPNGQVIPKNGNLRTAQQDKALFDAIALAYAQGASDAELKEQFGLVKVAGGSRLNSKAGLDALRRAAQEDAVSDSSVAAKSIGSCGGVDYAGTSASDINVAAPGFYAAQWPATGYVAMADWRWSDQPLGLSPHATGCYQQIGGVDGVGLTLSRDVTRTQQGLVICTLYGECHGAGNMDDNNARGASFTFQDGSTGSSSNSHHGTIAVGFKYLRPALCHQAFAKYFHTWKSTSVNGIGVGPYSFSVSWSSADNHWAKAGNAGNNGKC